MAEIVVYECPNCGANLKREDNFCPFCRSQYVITPQRAAATPLPLLNKYISEYKRVLTAEPDNNRVSVAMAYCFLQLKLYAKAQAVFDKAIEDDAGNSELYFYSAVCTLGGKKPFLQPRPVIDKALQYIEAAIMTEPRGLYYVLSAYIKYDYFKRKNYNISPNYADDLNSAAAYGVAHDDVAGLFAMLNADIPAGFAF